MEKISACLVVHNEEKLIARCLDSLRGVVDEIILVHDGACQDRTLEIAKNYGAKIFVRPFYGVAEGQRPFSYKQAVNNWILQIDADEFLSPGLRDKLSSLAADESVSAYQFIWPIWDGQKNVNCNWPYKIALFQKKDIIMWGLPHFIPLVSGSVLKIPEILYHEPTDNSFSFVNFFNKQLPWAKLQARGYLQDFSIIIKFNESRQDWPLTVKYRVRFPLLLLPLEFIWTYLKNISSGAYLAGRLGFKSAFLLSCYRASVNYFIFKEKQAQKYKRIV